MTDAPTTTTTTSDSPRVAGVPPVDPLARLHHMSTTAGVTSQEYVAINLPSIVATLLGLASVVVLIFGPSVLLVIPLAAIVFGVAALRQVRDSNGTQTGRLFAWAGIVLAVLVGGGQIVSRVVEARLQQSDEQQVAQLIRQLGEHVSKGDPGSAYQLFSDRFRKRVSRDRFDAQWKMVQTTVAPIKGIEWNGVPMIFERDGGGTMMGSAMTIFRFTGAPDGGRQAVIVRRGAGGWEIDDVPVLFPQDRRKREAQQ